MRKRVSGHGLLCLALVLTASVALATPVPTSTGTIVGGRVGVSATSLDFFSGFFPGGTCQGTTPGAGSGCFDVTPGTPAGALAGMTEGLIKDITGPPISGPILISQFLSFSNLPNAATPTVFFDMTNAPAGAGPGGTGQPDCNALTGAQQQAPGTTCVPHVGALISPIVLTNGPANPITGIVDTVAASFTIFGNMYTGTTADGSSPGSVIFTSQFSPSSPSGGQNIGSLINAIGLGQTVTNSWSGSVFATPSAVPGVPEPATSLMVGGGLVLAALVSRRFKRRRS